MLSLKSDTQADIIETFNNTPRYLDDIFNIDKPYFDILFPFIYPKEVKYIYNRISNKTAYSLPEYSYWLIIRFWGVNPKEMGGGEYA